MRKRKYKYQVGEVVNGNLKIVEQGWHIQKSGGKRKGYTVQSVNYPDAPTYTISEIKLNSGQGCSYTQGSRIYKGNSLYSVEHVRPFLVDIEEAKAISKGSHKKIVFKCPECSKERYTEVRQVVYQSYYCPSCDRGTSYPELFMMAYLEVKGIKYEYQKVFHDLPNRRFDFYIEKYGVVETHGRQHYSNDGTMLDYNRTQKSDKEKKEYCKNNTIPYIEIDARESTFKYIRDSINNSMLPNISEKEEIIILKYIENNKRYPVREIIELYNKCKNAVEVGNHFGVSRDIVAGVLRRNNIKLVNKTTYGKRGGHILSRKIKCLTTGEIFNCIVDANDKYNISTGCISRTCSGKRKSAGKHPITGEKLRWVYVD